MKVLKLGKEIKQECPSCKALILIEGQDWESPKGSGFNKTFVRCPICGELIYQDWILEQYNKEKTSDPNKPHPRTSIKKSFDNPEDVNIVTPKNSKSAELILEKKHAEGIDGAWDNSCGHDACNGWTE